MKRTSALALALLPLAALAPPPAAADGDGYAGGCRWNAVQNAFPPGSFGEEGHYHGGVQLAIVLESAPGALTVAQVSCVLVAEGKPSRVVLGPVGVTGAGVAAAPASYTVPAGHRYVTLCTAIEWADGRPDTFDCPSHTSIEVPPRDVKEAAWTVSRPLEAATCAVLGSQAPGTGPVEVTPEGDVHAGDEWVFDCPPYANPRQ